MSSTPDREPVHEALRAMLAVSTARPVGVRGAPTPPTMPYFVLYPQTPTGVEFASLESPDLAVGLRYQLRTVGQRDDQVEKAAARAHHAVFDRVGSGFVNAIEPDDGPTVIERRHEEGPGPIDSTGEGRQQVRWVDETLVLVVE